MLSVRTVPRHDFADVLVPLFYHDLADPPARFFFYPFLSEDPGINLSFVITGGGIIYSG